MNNSFDCTYELARHSATPWTSVPEQIEIGKAILLATNDVRFL
jgi:hypothetical protein